eukprot:2417499-Pleurochrysis_carterae.AAC.1
MNELSAQSKSQQAILTTFCRRWEHRHGAARLVCGGETDDHGARAAEGKHALQRLECGARVRPCSRDGHKTAIYAVLCRPVWLLHAMLQDSAS